MPPRLGQVEPSWSRQPKNKGITSSNAITRVVEDGYQIAKRTQLNDRMLYMRTRLMVLAAALALCSAPLRALDVKTYRESVQDAGDIQRAVAEMIYITGVGEGFTQANDRLSALGREKLYCAPGSQGLALANYRDILDRRIADEATRRTADELNQLNVEPLLLQGLIEAFPCAAKK